MKYIVHPLIECLRGEGPAFLLSRDARIADLPFPPPQAFPEKAVYINVSVWNHDPPRKLTRQAESSHGFPVGVYGLPGVCI